MGRTSAIISICIVLVCFKHDVCSTFTDKLKELHETAELSHTHVKRSVPASPSSSQEDFDPGNNDIGNSSTDEYFDYHNDDCPPSLKYQLQDIFYESYTGPVCNIIEARNSADALKDLENCTIVNGFVHIVFMHDLTEKDLVKYRFPKLRYITHYLLIYRVRNLKTLRYMFPNLAVIGGLETFRGYSLVLYENFHMVEVGLQNLRLINKGGVRIEKNPMLCYLDTIDWKRLGAYSNPQIEENVYMDKNRKSPECVDQCGEDSQCDDAERGNGQLCWGLKACQKKLCPANCPDACDTNYQCTCHKQCMAGCTSPNNASACLACKDKYYNNTCLSECPKGKYLIHGWLCIESEECQKLDWNFYNGTCVDMCPSGFQVNFTDCRRICTKCPTEDCGEDCFGDYTIDKLESLHQVDGCRSISGMLTISINGGSDVVERLDSVLKDLEVVGSISVRQSFPLVTMSFLKNLKRITGDNMQDEVFSVYFLENQNLKELWNMSDLTIERGKAFFHFNPKLCRSVISGLERLTPDKEDAMDISNVTNGDKGTCDIVPIKLLGVEIYSTKPFAIVRWENYTPRDDRTLIGYQVYYQESPEKDAEMYDGVDACRLNSWTVIELLKTSRKTPRYFSLEDFEAANFTGNFTLDFDGPVTDSNLLLPALKAFTQYAYYVRAYTTSRAGAISAIEYFKTNPARPSSPMSLRVTGSSNSTIDLKWDLPATPNGNITHYIIEWQRQHEELDNVRSSDTCRRGIAPSVEMEHNPATVKPTVSTPALDDEKQCPKTCDCEAKVPLENKVEHAKESTMFENFLQDHLFRPDPETIDFYDDGPIMEGNIARKKRSLYERPSNYSIEANSTDSVATDAPPGNESDASVPVVKEYPKYRMVVSGQTATLTGLHHFSEYSIQVYACNHASDPKSRTDLTFPIKEIPKGQEKNGSYTACSIEAMVMRRTAPDKSKDKIPGDVRVLRKERGYNDDKVALEWDMPPDPNAYIKNFQIEIKSSDKESNVLETLCVHVNTTADKDKKVSKVLAAPKDLPSGEYTGTITPVSLAGDGLTSHSFYFEVTDLELRRNNYRITITVASILGIVIIVAVVCILFYVRFRQKREHPGNDYPGDKNPDYSFYKYEPDEYEVLVENVNVLEEIGHGAFGKVFVGIAKGVVKGETKTRVAIKQLHDGASMNMRCDFLKEADMMKAFEVSHVVRLLGVVSQVPNPMVLMEFMANGDLKTYLRLQREDVEGKPVVVDPLSLQTKLQMATEVADGMLYLSDRKFIHRDLAARNCLVNDAGTVKIGDFGLAREVYECDYYRKESRGFLPIRWMAPESLKDGVFNSRSDVWSYGIVVWEIATLAQQPYQGKQHDEVTRFVIDGGYMEKPKDCPSKLYDLMKICWEYNPRMRPEFRELVNLLLREGEVNNQFLEISYYGNEDQFPIRSHPPMQTGHTYSEHMDASYACDDPGTSPIPSQPNGIGINGNDYYRNQNSNHQPGTPETRPLIPLERESAEAPCNDERSMNTMSTTAPRSPLPGLSRSSRENEYGSDSSYENESDESLSRGGYVSARDSGTFVRSERDAAPVRHKNRAGRRKSKSYEYDLESGLGENMCDNSTSHSSASTPTESHGLLPFDRRDTGHVLHTASTTC